MNPSKLQNFAITRNSASSHNFANACNVGNVRNISNARNPRNPRNPLAILPQHYPQPFNPQLLPQPAWFISLIGCFLLFLFASCARTTSNPTTSQPIQCTAPSGGVSTTRMAATANYEITFFINWSTATTGTNPLPGGAHFTTVAGANHNAGYTLWRTGTMASSGLEQLAETGGISILTNTEPANMGEIARAISTAMPPTAQQVLTWGGTGASGTTMTTATIQRAFPLVSVASMLAPSSDWFTGVSSFSLLDASANWLPSASLPLRIYDAGTEDDTVAFSLGNAEANPHVNIKRLTGSARIGFVPPLDVVGCLSLLRKL